MSTLKPAALLIAIIALVAVGSQQKVAAEPGEVPLVVILADRDAVVESDGGFDLIDSFVGLVSTLREGQQFVFVSADRPGEVLGPVVAGTPEFRAFHQEIFARMASDEAASGPDMVSALAEMFNYLGSRRAPRGSMVYLVVGAAPQTDLEEAAYRLGPTAALFEESGWPIVGIGLPGAAPEVVAFLDAVSTGSGGESVTLSVPDGFRAVTDRILRTEAKGSLSQISEALLSSDSVLTSTVSIAPGTSEATLMFFKAGPAGSLRLSNPLGFEASSGDRTASSVVETPHVVIWRLVDPAPGEWKIDIRGTEGLISAWHYAANKYGVALSNQGAIALNEPAPLVAYATSNREIAILDSVTLLAHITSPNGQTLSYELNDAGLLGDAVAGDGYFSATVSPLTDFGRYNVELELTWEQYAHTITSHASFRAQEFPTIEVSPVATDGLEEGARTMVASLSVQLAGQAYALAETELSIEMISTADEAGKLELVPKRILSDGRAWLYDVYFTPEGGGQHSVSFEMNIEYAGRQHTFSPDHMVITSVAAPPPITERVLFTIPAVQPVIVTTRPPDPVQVVRPSPSSQDVAAASTPLVTPPLRTIPASSGFPWVLLGIPSVALMLMMAGIVYWLTRAYPYGYLYNDKDEPILDFAGLERRRVMSVFFKNWVFGKELGLPGLEGVSFKFFRKRIGLKTRDDSPTVRVNNQPVVGESPIHHRTWIGSHGKLYSFLIAEPPRLEPGAADD
jgi:hypothetical protein